MQRVVRPASWPPLMTEKKLASGRVAYYWSPPTRDVRAGCPCYPEALGNDYGTACQRAQMLNANLKAWRSGLGAVKDLDHGHRFGTLGWLVERYKRSNAWEKVSRRSRPEYIRALALILDHPLTDGRTLGDLPAKSITARAADMAYARLRNGPRGSRTRQAVVSINRMARAWDVIARLYRETVPQENPWRGVELEHSHGTTKPATRSEMLALHRALVAMGEAHLAAVPLICFEWHLRPENVLSGCLTWLDWKPADRREEVRLAHGKTGAIGWLKLAAESTKKPRKKALTIRLFPELEDYLDQLARAGDAVVLMTRERHGLHRTWRQLESPRPYRMAHAQRLVREARVNAGLGEHVTLAACRHGGMTELGDAGLTEQAVMALSQHATPEASRLYVKRTEAQRSAAALQRRQYVESRP